MCVGCNFLWAGKYDAFHEANFPTENNLLERIREMKLKLFSVETL